MAEGFGQYLNLPPRMRELKKRIQRERATDSEDLMIIIIDELKEEALYPEVGKFYTFIYNAKTPGLRYDQHPLIACTSIEPWGFRGINFHWKEIKQYTWSEIIDGLYIVYPEEIKDLQAIPYKKIQLS